MSLTQLDSPGVVCVCVVYVCVCVSVETGSGHPGHIFSGSSGSDPVYKLSGSDPVYKLSGSDPDWIT